MAANTPPYVLQSGSHSAQLFRQAISTLLGSTGGVVDKSDYLVTANGTPNMTVNVAGGIPGGRIWIPGTSSTGPQGLYYGYNDASVSLAIAASNPTNPRIDRAVAQIQDAAYSGAVNSFTLNIVTGTAAGSPVAPAVPASSLSLATVAVAANATTIVSGNITDTRIVSGALSGGVYIGELREFGMATLPAGWLACDASAVSRTKYASLFSALGTTWGSGDGSTTFNVPDVRGRSTVGSGTGTASGATAKTLGSRPTSGAGGEETHALSVGELAAHDHGGVVGSMNANNPHSHGEQVYTAQSGTGGVSVGTLVTPNQQTATTDINHGHPISSQGSGTGHNTMSPYAVVTYAVYAGV